MRKRERRHQAQPFPYVTLTEALRRAIQAPKLRRYFRAMELARDWHEVVGPVIAQHVRPLSLEKNVLTLKADSSVWRQQVSFMKDQIIAKIEEKYSHHTVKDVRIR